MTEKSRKRKWIMRLRKERQPGRTVHQILQRRRRAAAAASSTARHLRAVLRDGDDGLRCYDCHHIPLKPWEPVAPGGAWSCSCAGDDGVKAEGCIYRAAS